MSAPKFNFGTPGATNPGFSTGTTAGSSLGGTGGLNLSLSGTGGGTQAAPTGGLALNSTTTTAAASAATTTAPATSTTTMTFKTLEEHINSWMNDLDSQEKEFLDQACQLNALDRLMIDNGEKIVDVNNDVDRLKNEQNKLEQELDFIMGQQNYLEQSIKKLETGIEQMPPIAKQYGDDERVQTYQILLTIDNQVKTMSTDLKDIIKRLNATNVNLNDPAVQISKILNAHMDSLSYIEDNTSTIQNQVDQLSKSISDKIKDTDKPSKTSLFY